MILIRSLRNWGIDWKSDTLDKGDHLNLSGAHKITDYMITYLQEHYVLPDHRGDEKFTSWRYDGRAVYNGDRISGR